MDTKQLLEAVETIRIVQSLFVGQHNEWLPVIAAVGGAFVGGVSTFFPNYFLELKKRRDERMSVSCALVAEVRALLTIVEQRQYINGLKKVAQHLINSPAGTTAQYCVKVPDHYSRVYQAHVDRLGVVDPHLAAKIIEFHQLMDSAVQDVSTEGMIAQYGGDVAAFQQLIAIAEAAVAVGSEITQR